MLVQCRGPLAGVCHASDDLCAAEYQLRKGGAASADSIKFLQESNLKQQTKKVVDIAAKFVIIKKDISIQSNISIKVLIK